MWGERQCAPMVSGRIQAQMGDIDCVPTAPGAESGVARTQASSGFNYEDKAAPALPRGFSTEEGCWQPNSLRCISTFVRLCTGQPLASRVSQLASRAAVLLLPHAALVMWSMASTNDLSYPLSRSSSLTSETTCVILCTRFALHVCCPVFPNF